MDQKFYQACYGHLDMGWSVLNESPDLPKSIVEDFLAVERGNAAVSSGEPVPMGQSETPSCMMELYCRNDVLGLVRIQYQISDLDGRPISFAHGYLFPDAYEILKEPGTILRVQRENFADQSLPPEEWESLRDRPGAINHELIKRSAQIPASLTFGDAYPSPRRVMTRCGMNGPTYLTWLKAVYAQLLISNTQKNLYVKTDGTEKNALDLLYLTYIALPYSLRPLLSASTCLHREQRNTKLIFCAVLPEDTPYIDPVTGENNVLAGTAGDRLIKRNPIICDSVPSVLAGSQDKCFQSIESCLKELGDVRLSSMQAIGLAYSMFRGEFHRPERLPILFYNWLALPVANTEFWEKTASVFLVDARKFQIKLSSETQALLTSRAKSAVTERFAGEAEQYLKTLGKGDV